MACIAAVGVLLAAADVAAAGGLRGRPLPPPALVIAAVHADVTMIDAQARSQHSTWDKGKVTAKSDGSLSLTRADGKTVTLAIDATTRVWAKNGRVNVGDVAIVFSRDGKATFVVVFQTRLGPPPPFKTSGKRIAREGPTRLAVLRLFCVPRNAVHADWALISADGKSGSLAFDRGQVTAKSSGAMTLKRADGKSVTLAIDDKTKIRRDGVEIGERAAAFSREGKALVVLSSEEASD